MPQKDKIIKNSRKTNLPQKEFKFVNTHCLLQVPFDCFLVEIRKQNSLHASLVNLFFHVLHKQYTNYHIYKYFARFFFAFCKIDTTTHPTFMF